jgi:hypothetical protein
MDETNIERLVSILKLQAEAFLLDAREFYPFGTYIDMEDKIVPVGAYLGDGHPMSLEVIEFLEKTFAIRLQKGECKIAAIAIDSYMKQNDEKYDGIEIRFFEVGKEVYKKYFIYIIKDSYVEFHPHIV